MIALCNNDAESAAVVAVQTLFIPRNLSGQRLVSLPLSRELSLILRKLGIKSLGDLNGVSLKDFQRVSNRSSALVIELDELPQKLREDRSSPESISKTATSSIVSASSIPPAALPESQLFKAELYHADTIVIPQEERGRLLSSFSVSVRLMHIFQFKKFRILGELHGLTYSEIAKYRNCGRRTVEELRGLVRSVQRGGSPATTTVDGTPYSSPNRSDCFFIPSYARDFSPLDLPISVRLANVLESKGIVHLGDLQGRDLGEFKGLANCGTRTLGELESLIERIAAGEFQSAAGNFSPDNTVDLLRMIDDGFAKLPTHWREMLLLRLGGEANRCWTLEEVGQKFKLTRERIRQITKKALVQIKKIAGPKINGYLRGVAAICSEKVCPLSPTLLTKWLGGSPAKLQFFPVTYVRLLGELDPGIMGAVRSSGNKATEMVLVKLMRRHGIIGWRQRVNLRGKPDFVFTKLRVAIFVDGCFWHGCSKHCRMPQGNRNYWQTKIAGNRVRDAFVSRALRRTGWRVLRIWEHELARKNEARLVRRIQRALR